MELEPGESKQAEIVFDDKTFRYWNRQTNTWEVEGGERDQILIRGKQQGHPLIGRTVPGRGRRVVQPYSEGKNFLLITAERLRRLTA